MELLKRLYYDLSSPVSFTSAKRVHAEAKKTDKTISLKMVQKFLEEQKVYNLHRLPLQKFKRSITKCSGLFTDIQIDLGDVRDLRKSNK
jgi:hypothetical protein